MYTCAACLQRAINSLYHAQNVQIATRYNSITLPTLRSSLTNLGLSPSAKPFRHFIRLHSTLQSIRKGHHRRKLLNHLENKNATIPPNSRRNPGKPNPVEFRDKIARENNRKLLDRNPVNSQLRRRSEFEAQFIVSDPIKLANAVVEKLRDGSGAPREYGDIEAALELVRASEKVAQVTRGKDGELVRLEKKGTVENVVSWNHIIDWLMEKGDSRQAQKVYNEMKKRGHRPDAHTYTIMLRGFSKNVRKPNAVKDAVNVYNSIYAPNSIVTPNTIHTNAIINTCARGGDMDSLWAIVGKLPEKGPGAPDKWTFTTILNAIQHDASKRAAKVIAVDGKEKADIEIIFDEAINDGRKLWRDVVTRWRKGDLMVDEALVCAMGRLLLLSNKNKDVGDVFQLIQQTMNIKIPAQKSIHIGRKEKLSDESPDLVSPTDASQSPVGEVVGEFAIIPGLTTSNSQVGLVQSSIYAVPGSNCLSMLIEAATVVRQLPTGKAYWDILTSPDGQYKVGPDAQNVIAYLRLLRISRSSKTALELLQRDWPKEVSQKLYTRGTFTIAMSTCVRDKNNPNVFDTASRLLDLMQEKMSFNTDEIDDINEDDYEDHDTDHKENIANRTSQMLELEPKVLTMYLSLAIATTKGLGPGLPLQRKEDGDLDFERNLNKNNIIRALRRLGPDLVNIKRLLKLKVAESQQDDVPLSVRAARRKKKSDVDVPRVTEKFDDLVGLLRGMIGAYDRIVAINEKLETDGMGPLESNFINECWSQKRKLSAFLGKMVSKKDQEQLQWQGKKTGLWEGYEPGSGINKETSTLNNTAAEKDSDEFEVTVSDEYLARTPASAKIKKMIKREIGDQQRHQKSLHLSKRQKGEMEKARRFERVRNESLSRFQSSYQKRMPNGLKVPDRGQQRHENMADRVTSFRNLVQII